MPDGARDLIQKILNIDEIKRPTTREIMDHPWMNIGYEKNELKPYTEPELVSEHQNKISKSNDVLFFFINYNQTSHY